MQGKAETPWPLGSVLYQIYPRSFYDSDGDGVGDLPGVISKLDYLNDLGVNALWLTPFYPSPMVDLGYDVSDFCDVDPLFGSLKDFKHLVAEAHAHGMYVLVDLVPNHTSDQHPWFLDSKSSKDSSKRDWYIWRDGKAGGRPPNNWQSVFSGSAWQLDEPSGQYYLHSFLRQQPDINWENPVVRRTVKDVMRFWLDLGADGFRADAVSYISKDPNFNDEPERDDKTGLLALNIQYGPRLYEYLEELAQVLKEYDGKFMVTEAYADDLEADELYYEQFYTHVDTSVAAPFNLEAIHKPWRAADFGSFINRFQAALKKPSVPVYSFSNHDNPRLVTRLGSDAARSAAVLQLSLPGMPVIYYGDELGMTDGDNGNFNADHPSSDLARYPARTPMQWSGEPSAGFTKSNKPWLPVTSNYKTRNVASELADPGSLLNLYKRLIALRKSLPVLSVGSYEPLKLTNKDVFGFSRVAGNERLTVLVNFSNESQPIAEALPGRLILSSCKRSELGSQLVLAPNEALIIARS